MPALTGRTVHAVRPVSIADPNAMLTVHMPRASCDWAARYDIPDPMQLNHALRSPAPHAIRAAGDDAPDGGDVGGGNEGEGQLGLATRTRAKPKKPSQYKVLMLNDDYTPMEFVVMVLKRFFRMDLEQATRVMLHVHQRGVGVCGIFPYEVAETKVNQVMDFARQNQHPLQCTLEKA
jgi:ATP-dependent Clp protease adaptor protein ClpS